MPDKNELIELVFKWQNSPKEYTNLLVEETYNVLRALCEKEVKAPYNLEIKDSVSASSLVNEVYIKLDNGLSDSDKVTCLKTFYMRLARIVKQVLLDRHRQIQAQKRRLNNSDNINERYQYKEIHIGNNLENKKYDIDVLISAIDKVKEVAPRAYDALTLRYFTTCDIDGIAESMSLSKSRVETVLNNGRTLVDALANESIAA